MTNTRQSLNCQIHHTTTHHLNFPLFRNGTTRARSLQARFCFCCSLRRSIMVINIAFIALHFLSIVFSVTLSVILSVLLPAKCPRQESNPHQKIRNLLFYPLNYSDKRCTWDSNPEANRLTTGLANRRGTSYLYNAA